MAGKHYIIATQTGYLDGEFHSKEAAVKALSEEVKHAAQACRRRYKTCSVVGSARSGSVQILIGGRQGYHMWQRYVINERPGARKPPRDVREAKKTPAQLDAEITAALANGGEKPGTVAHSTIASTKRALTDEPCDSFEPCHGNYACRIHADSTPGTMEYKRAKRMACAKPRGSSHATIATRDYEYIVYPEATHRHADRAVKIPMRRVGGAVRPYDLVDAKRAAKQMGAPAAIYSVSKGRFVGYVHPSGRYVTFR